MEKITVLRERARVLGAEVKAARESKKLKRGDLARQIKELAGIQVSDSYFYLLENGKRIAQVPDGLALAIESALELGNGWLKKNEQLCTMKEARHYAAVRAGRTRTRHNHRKRGRKGNGLSGLRKRKLSRQLGLPLTVKKAQPTRRELMEAVERLEGARMEADLRKAEAPVQQQSLGRHNFWALALGLKPERTGDGWVVRWGDIQGVGKSPGEALLLFERAMDQES